MVYWISPPWKDIFLRVREEMGDEVIYYYFNNNIQNGINEMAQLPKYINHGDSVKVYGMDLKEIVTSFTVNRNFNALKIPLSFDDRWLKSHIEATKEIYYPSPYPANYSQHESYDKDYSKPLKEIYLYDVFFLKAFNSMIYDAFQNFEGNDEEFQKITQIKAKIKKIIQQGFMKLHYYDTIWDSITPHVTEKMQETLILGYLGYPIWQEEREEWTWISKQWVTDDEWKTIMSINESVFLSPHQWFSKIWQIKNIIKPFMNWNSSPFKKT